MTEKDMTTSRGRSCGLTVRRRPPTGQEERPRRKPPCRHSDLGLPHTQAGLNLPLSAQEPWAVGSTQAIPGSQLPPSCPDLNFGHAWVGLARAGALALHWVRMLWKAGCLLTGVWSGQLGPHACPLHQVGAPIWLGCSGWGGAEGVGPSPTGLTSSLDSLPLPVMESALGRPVSELTPCPSGMEGWLCPWYTSARVHSQMTIQGVWLEIYSTHQLLRASTARDEMLTE